MEADGRSAATTAAQAACRRRERRRRPALRQPPQLPLQTVLLALSRGLAVDELGAGLRHEWWAHERLGLSGAADLVSGVVWTAEVSRFSASLPWECAAPASCEAR